MINIATGLCTFPDGREISLKQVLHDSDFSHPLLIEPFIPSSNMVFHYEYDDVDGLLYAAIYVYSILLQVKNPDVCQFKINPSSIFQALPCRQALSFSIKSGHAAKDFISIKQFEALISRLSDYPFTFSHDVLIRDHLTLKDLPSAIDGDMLYYSNDEIVNLLKKPEDLQRYELRYINFSMGLGVFSRDGMKDGDVVGVYSGVKTAHPPSVYQYMFERKEDCLMMTLDARQTGNITRFINHAPSERPTKTLFNRWSALEANVKATHHYLNGIEVVVFTTKKDIPPGEQLLLDYGNRYFKNGNMAKFKTKGRVIDTNIKSIWMNWQKKLTFIRLAACYGVKKAETYLFFRQILIITVITLLMTGLSWRMS